MSYKRVNWEDSPSTATPLNAKNLNIMDEGISNLETEVNSKLADETGSVTAMHIAYNSIFNNRIVDGTITTDKLNENFIDDSPRFHEVGGPYLVTSNGVYNALLDKVDKSQTIAGLDLQDNITAEELQAALSTYPVILGSSAPDTSTVGKRGQFYLDYVRGKIYLCISVTGGAVYSWKELQFNTDESGNTGNVVDLGTISTISDFPKPDDLDITATYKMKVTDEVAAKFGTSAQYGIFAQIIRPYPSDINMLLCFTDDGHIYNVRYQYSSLIFSKLTYTKDECANLFATKSTQSSTAPTTETPGQIGDLYIVNESYNNIQDKKPYICSDNEIINGKSCVIWTALETSDNKVTTVSAESTDIQYPSALAVYNAVNDVKQLVKPDVPDYWQDAVNDVIATVKSHQDKAGVNAVTFALFSDIHYGSNHGNTGKLAAAVMDECDIPFAVFNGDAVRSSVASSADEIEADFEAVREMLSPIGSDRLIQTVGNHDGNWGTANGVSYAYNFSPEKLYNRIFRPQANNYDRVFSDDGSYFYVDDKARKVRFIVLNSVWCKYEENEDGTAVTSKQNNYGFGQQQIDWLAETALNFSEDGWSVVIASHVPIIDMYNDTMRDISIIRGVLTAFANKSTYTGTYEGTVSGGSSYTNLADPTSTDWKTDYRINSSGVETALAGCTISNYIAIDTSSVVHVKDFEIINAEIGGGNYGRVNFYDSDKNFIAQVQPSSYPDYFKNADYDSSVVKFDMNELKALSGVANAAYMRVQGISGDSPIITINEDISQNVHGWDYVTVDVDYSSKTTADVIGYFSGHLHADRILDNGLPFKFITITCDSDLSYDTNEDERISGTDNEHAIDFVTIDKSERKVYLTRLGVGSDREFSY